MKKKNKFLNKTMKIMKTSKDLRIMAMPWTKIIIKINQFIINPKSLRITQ
jgi:hypothetical protein